jgi:nitrogen regulatory protein PII 1
MKMIQAIIRPEKEKEVLNSLEKTGIHAFTRLDVFGRGRQKGIQVGPVRYEEMAKVWLLVIVEDMALDRALQIIKIAARTGNPGDGKIFVSSLLESRTLRTQSKDEE